MILLIGNIFYFMNSFRSSKLFFQKFDWVLLLLVFIVISIGLAAIYSVDISKGLTLTFFPTQIIAMTLGIFAMIVAANLHTTIYQKGSTYAVLIAIILLVAVLFLGVNIRGTTGWFRFAGFSFQPAEIAKLAFILFMANWMDLYHRQFHRWQFVVSSGIVVMMIIGLILLQPDLGSAFLIGATWFGFLLVANTKNRYILSIIGAGILAVIIGWLFLFKPYQKDRLMTFVNPESDPLGAGYNVTQSIIAIGAGNFKGRGLGFGSQSQLHFLPEAQTDFVFSVIGEELGFIGVFILLSLICLILWRLTYIAYQADDDFKSYLVIGIALLLFVQTMVNVGAAIGVLPVTGVPLPFVSYGGSSLLLNLFMIGIVEAVVLSK